MVRKPRVVESVVEPSSALLAEDVEARVGMTEAEVGALGRRVAAELERGLPAGFHREMALGHLEALLSSAREAVRS